MKRNLKKLLTPCLALASSFMLTGGALADSLGTPVTTRAQAEKLLVGSKVMLACAKCKTTLITEVDRKKGFLAWFAPKTRHECPGCGSTFTFVPLVNPGKGMNMRVEKHTCSLCGPNSVACSTNAPGHKVKKL